MAFTKVSIDSAAKEYWKLLWSDYGEALCKEIPRRIKAELVATKKVASVNDSALVLPVAHSSSGGLLHLEGIYKDDSTRLMFHASIDADGVIKDIKSFELR